MDTTTPTDPILENRTTMSNNKSGTADYELSDHGNALRLINKYGTDIRYYNSNLGEGWYIWDGTTWCADLRGNIHQKAKNTIDEMYEDLPRLSDRIEASKLLKFILHSKNQRALINMISSAQNEPGVFIDKEKFDSHKNLINVMNGVVDLQSGELQPHKKSLLLSKKIIYEYDPCAECPRWEKFIEEISDHKEIPGYLQRFFGYCITGHTSEQMFVIANGLGGNGKGTMTDTIMHVLGPYVRTAEPSTVIKKKYERSSSNDLADLFGYRLVVASETDPDQVLDEGRVKRMTGEDRIKCRLLYREFFEYDPQFKLLLLTNHRPTIESQDFSIWRRIKQVDFDKRFDENTADQQLRATLLQEAPGILRWLVDGAMEWYKHGLMTPEVVTNITGDYKEEMDIIGGFIEMCIEKDQSSKVTIKDLYDLYLLWSQFIDEIPITKTKLGAKLSERGFQAKRSNGIRWRIGLKINDDVLKIWTEIKEEFGSKVPISAVSAVFTSFYKSSYTSKNSTDSSKITEKSTGMSTDSDSCGTAHAENTNKPAVSMTQISGILNIIRTEWYSLGRPEAPLSIVDTFVGELIKRCESNGRELSEPAARIFVINAYTAWGWPTY